MTPVPTARLIILSLGAGALISGCTPTTKETAEATPVETAAPAPQPLFSVNELMVMVVDRPGELLWNAEKEGKGPKTAEDWYQLENHAVEVATAGTLLQLGGTGPSDADWASQPKWKASAQAMSSAALSARAAAKARSLPALIKANGDIVAACEACHKDFKPDIPTGGMFMHRGPEAAAKS